uniref:Zinc carboxypeptidase n=1 Tax=Toxoplasma gondii (strain ATCC 50861 / VEG) TaxID=432359 RepID=A0A0F7UZ64_TOXGV|nr:TPA: Zinc carboxypeptidase [Toxoplasma gondii VEG]
MKCVPGLAVIAGTFVSMLRASAELPHYYHTTPQLKEEVEKLGKDCDGFSVHHEPIGNDHTIEFVTVSRASGNRDRFFLLAGEHSRELISAESALHFLQVLCERETKLAEKARKVLQHTNIQVVVNGNPVSRAKVEAGDFCLRGNENNVDLNRNWGGKLSAIDKITGTLQRQTRRQVRAIKLSLSLRRKHLPKLSRRSSHTSSFRFIQVSSTWLLRVRNGIRFSGRQAP